MRQETRFDGLFESPGYWNLPILFASREEVILDYFNMWSVTRTFQLTDQSNKGADQNLEELLDISIYLLAATAPAPSYPSTSNATLQTNEKSSQPYTPHFDFFLLHLLLSCHAIRVLFKNLPFSTHQTLLEAQFLATISYYVSELRPHVSMDLIKSKRAKIEEGELGSKDWTYVRRQCLELDVKAECSNGGEYLRGNLTE
jgi:hypothetical protein